MKRIVTKAVHFSLSNPRTASLCTANMCCKHFSSAATNHATLNPAAENNNNNAQPSAQLIDASSSPAANKSSYKKPSPDDYNHLVLDFDENLNLKLPQFEYIPANELPNKTSFTPLCAELHSQMKVRGAIPVADYMFQCMQNQQFGYYMNKQNIIGERGDFITSPEINQVFNEIMAVWLVQNYNLLGRPAAINIVELGPGRGTLISQSLSIIKQISPQFYERIAVHLIETSPIMRGVQQEALKVKFDVASQGLHEKIMKQREESINSGSSRSNLAFSAEQFGEIEVKAAETTGNLANDNAPVGDAVLRGKNPDGIQVFWHSNLKSIDYFFENSAASGAKSAQNASSPDLSASPRTPTLILAHEFFDALPVFQFQLTERGWCEILVDIDCNAATADHLRFVLSPGPTPAARAFIPESIRFAHKQPKSAENGENKAEISGNAAKTSENKGMQWKIGDQMEFCPAAVAVTEEIVKILQKTQGSALIIDYGFSNSLPSNTLQAVKQHKFVSPLTEPGLVDLTTLVNFSALRAAAIRTAEMAKKQPKPSEHVEIYPLVTQSTFLRELGIAQRVEKLFAGAKTAELQQYLLSSATRLVSLEEMGGLFKCFAVAVGLQERPVPFHIKEDQQLREYERIQKEQRQKETSNAATISTEPAKHNNDSAASNNSVHPPASSPAAL
jgi:NADH dehydrogenase [ubiquinone] 1 alpha subcomplex assembly factor 7